MTSLMQANEARSTKRHQTETIKDTFNAEEAWERLIGYSKTGYASITDEDKDFALWLLAGIRKGSVKKVV